MLEDFEKKMLTGSCTGGYGSGRGIGQRIRLDHRGYNSHENFLRKIALLVPASSPSQASFLKQESLTREITKRDTSKDAV